MACKINEIYIALVMLYAKLMFSLAKQTKIKYSKSFYKHFYREIGRRIS
jgi:hypothetical protein